MTTHVTIQAAEHAVRAELTDADGENATTQVVEPSSAGVVYVWGDKRLVITELPALDAKPPLDEVEVEGVEATTAEAKSSEDTKPAA